MKKLYALLMILIVIYVGMNVSVNGFDILTPKAEPNQDTGFPELDNFTETVINDTAVRYLDNITGVNIELEEISNSTNITAIYQNLANGSSYTSSQQIDQKGVTVYFLYNEGSANYNTDIYFNKNGKNYHMSGYNTTYANSDYFINHCKQLIDTI